MSAEYLTAIIDHKKKLIHEKSPLLDTLRDKVSQSEHSRYSIFKQKISQEGQINLIAEIKKASPSKGLIREDFNYKEIAKIYEENGAAAISVLTEDKFFLGDLRYLEQLSFDCKVPLLMKDFVVDERQIYEARHCGASAVLLIMAILDDSQVKQYIDVATKLDVDCLVEVHNKDELLRAVDCGAEIIGVNNRNLTTFETDLKNSFELIPQIPDNIVKVAESGIRTHDDVVQLQECGAHAILIGETFMKEEDIGNKVKEVLNG